MSFSWKQNMIGGQVGNDNFSSVNVTDGFPVTAGINLQVPQNISHSQLYEIPTYLRLGDMTPDKPELRIQRGGYSGENVNKLPIPLQCFMQQQSSQYYCGGRALQY